MQAWVLASMVESNLNVKIAEVVVFAGMVESNINVKIVEVVVFVSMVDTNLNVKIVEEASTDHNGCSRYISVGIGRCRGLFTMGSFPVTADNDRNQSC